MRFLERFDEIKWYLLACIICFFGIPLLAAVLPQYAGIVQAISQFTNVLVIDVTSFLCGFRHFRWYYPILAMLLFAIPAAVGSLYTIDSIVSASLYYLILSFLAAGIGFVIAKLLSRGM